MRVIWSRTAISHLAEIRGYIADDRPEAARRVAPRIRDAVGRLAEHLHLGRPGLFPGIREFVVSGTPYVVPYTVHKNAVAILAVFHDARQRSVDLE